MSYSDHLKQDRKLRILQMLCGDKDYGLNIDVLKIVLRDFSHSVSDDLLLCDVHWLEEQDLVTIQKLQLGVVVTTATSRGVDVAFGRASHPSIRRPTVVEIKELKDLCDG